MNIFVHLLIAGAVKKSVSDQVGIRLNSISFLYGSILPDISGKYQEFPHFLRQSFGFVLDSAEALTDPGAGLTASSSYGLKAGVLTHYLSDYFCYVHSEKYQGGICRHHLYEAAMLFSFRRALLLIKGQKYRSDLRPQELGNFILSSVEEYQAIYDGKEKDIYYAIRISVAIAVCLLREAMVSEARLIFKSAPRHQTYFTEGDMDEGSLLL